MTNTEVANKRIKTLEYRSIDAEARSRRNNLIFRGIPEILLSEDCVSLIHGFLKDNLDIESTQISIQRAHRLGIRTREKSRPIIVCFRDSQNVELILSNAYKLKGKPEMGINRDYPNEIAEARARIWPKYKVEKARNPAKTVHLGFPAKLIVKKKVVCDEFPDWQLVLKQSRNHTGNKTRPIENLTQ